MKGSAFCAVLTVLILQTGIATDSTFDSDGTYHTVDYDTNATVQPSVAPRFLSGSFHLTVVVGDTATFPCESEFPSNISIVWMKGDDDNNFKTDIHALQDERFQIVNGTTLQIAEVVPTDSGYYTCQVATEPPLELFHSLKVKSRPGTARHCSGKSEKWIDLGGNYCYLIERDMEVTWMEAVYQCFLEGGSLVTFQSMEELQRVHRYLKNDDGKLYIGLWKHNDGSFEWVDKSPSTFRNWAKDEPNDRSETCVEIYLDSGKWNDIPCSLELGYMCYALKSKSDGQTASVPRNVCPDSSSDWKDLGTEYCYIIAFKSEATSDEAAAHCSATGGSLASFHSIEEISVVRNEIKHHPDRMHIGLRQNSDGMFQWTDRSPADLDFWDQGEPNDIEEQCGEIYPRSGLWNDIPCSKSEGFICSTPKVNPEISVMETTPSTAGEICGGVISGEAGTIQSPNYPENYNPNGNCVWKITVPENRQVQFSIQVLQLEYGADCEFDYVEVRDGGDEDSPILRTVCGSDNQESVLSSGNVMLVKFSSDQVNQASGFLAVFKAVPQCGEIIVAEEGVIQSRNYPDKYMSNDACTWKITVPEGNAVLLKFKAFEVEDTFGCFSDYVEILDGHDATSGVLGRLCGYYLPSEIRSSGHKMTVRLMSDSTQEYFGFLAGFKKAEVQDSFPLIQHSAEVQDSFPLIQHSDAVQSSCQSSIDYEKGTLVSPNYPDYYNSNDACTWTIRASQGSKISLRFKSFDLEHSNECTFDFVRIYDGPDTDDSPLLGVFCGSTVPNLITSSGSQMTIHFETDSSAIKTGFAATMNTNEGGIIENDLLQKEACDECITGDEGFIQSPNYPANYEPSVTFSWKITVPSGHQVVLNFKDFKVETHVVCAYDYVLVRDGHGPRSPVLAKLCGYEVPKEIRSSGNELMIEFKSDSSGEYSGFSAEFKKNLPVIPTGSPSQPLADCGGDIYAENGTIHSPNYPSPYGPHQKCTWKITVPEGNLVFLKFASLKLEKNPSCSLDYVTVLDGDDADSPVLNRICDYDNLHPITSTKNKITVKFTSDDSFEGSGFAATFKTVHVCGGNIVASEGVIQSPNITDGNGYKCSWRITVPEPQTVLLKIHENPSSSYTTGNFFVAIHDGPDVSSPNLRNYYYLDQEFKRVRSTGNEMFVIVASESSEGLPHFYAEFEKDICGGNITAGSGVINSPNYPDKYPPKEDCTWRIIVPENYKVVLSIQAFDLEGGSCTFDFVEVRDGYSEYSPVIGKYCGSIKPPKLRSSGNIMYLRFKSDGSTEGQGFSSEFLKFSCGGNITAERGLISSPDFPDHYRRHSFCIWRIAVPEGNTVALNFKEFRLETSDDCRYDSLEIYDGHNPFTSPLLQKLCGINLPDTIRSTTNTISLKFSSDGASEEKGFSAEFFAEPESYPELENMLRQLPNMIFEHTQKKPKPSKGGKKKKKPIMKRSLLDNLEKIFMLAKNKY